MNNKVYIIYTFVKVLYAIYLVIIHQLNIMQRTLTFKLRLLRPFYILKN